MQTLKRAFSVGLFCLLMLSSGQAMAFYSPLLSSQAGMIQEHIRLSQEKNGSGSLLEMSQEIIAQDRLRREKGKSSANSGLAAAARNEILADATSQAFQQPFDSLMMVFNFLPSSGGLVSNCLRDDLWTLTDLKSLVGREMVKAYLLGDIFHGDQLKRDWAWLTKHIDLLKRQGNDPKAKLTVAADQDGKKVAAQVSMQDYLFGEESEIYYYAFALPSTQGCPQGEFEAPFVKIANSAKALATLSSGRGADWNWGSIWEMAQVQAKQRAAQWFAANQISATLGAEGGGQTQSLVQADGWDQWVGQAQTQLQILEDLAGPVAAPFSWGLYERIDGVNYVGSDSACAYYDSGAQKFYPCTPQQLEVFNVCKLSLAEAKEQNIARTRRNLRQYKQPYGCSRFAVTDRNQVESQLAKSVRLKQEARELQEERENEALAFRYHLQLNQLGEGNLNALSQSLVKWEVEIRRGVEAVDERAGLGLPAMLKNVVIFESRHCPNKQ